MAKRDPLAGGKSYVDLLTQGRATSGGAGGSEQPAGSPGSAVLPGVPPASSPTPPEDDDLATVACRLSKADRDALYDLAHEHGRQKPSYVMRWLLLQAMQLVREGALEIPPDLESLKPRGKR